MPGFPISPTETTIYNPGVQYAIDVGFSDPRLDPQNAGFQILGVNIYRSYEDPKGPYTKVNTDPIQVGYYRDEHKISLKEEDVSGKFISRGTNPRKEWVFKVDNPIVLNNVVYQQYSEGQEVFVNIDGQDIKPLRVDGAKGLVYLNTSKVYDPISHISSPAILPNQDSDVLCKYYHVSNFVQTNLNRRLYYKLCTYGYDVIDRVNIETPLASAPVLSLEAMAEAEPVWQEAMRRNNFILEQGGERVKLFLRKWSGDSCPNNSTDHKSTLNDCTICFGTSYIGGYTGPYDILIASPDESKSLEATPEGLKPTFMFETWTGPSPIISQRDFIIRKNGDRFSIGPVNLTTVNGAPLQQRFNVSILGSRDIRYSVPINPDLVTPPNKSPAAAPSTEVIRLRKKVWEDLF